MQERKSRPRPTDGESDGALFFAGEKWALIGGLLSVGVALGGQLLVGQVYGGAEARQLLQTMIPAARSVGGAVSTASATILALMLTMLGLMRQADNQFERSFYRQVKRTGMLTAAALAGSILLLLFLSVPLLESQTVPGGWYEGVYYTVVVASAALSGLLVTIVLTLYGTLRSLIHVLSPGEA